MDKKEGNEGDLQYFKAYDWNGEALEHKFSIDFLAEKLGRPHQMRFGAYSLYASTPPNQEVRLASAEAEQ